MKAITLVGLHTTSQTSARMGAAGGRGASGPSRPRHQVGTHLLSKPAVGIARGQSYASNGHHHRGSSWNGEGAGMQRALSAPLMTPAAAADHSSDAPPDGDGDGDGDGHLAHPCTAQVTAAADVDGMLYDHTRASGKAGGTPSPFSDGIILT